MKRRECGLRLMAWNLLNNNENAQIYEKILYRLSIGNDMFDGMLR